MTRLTLPPPPAEPQPSPFPIFAVLAPVVGALALFAILQSPYVLLFAILGPIIAIASVFDQRLGRRRQRRRALRVFEAEAEQLRERARTAADAALAARCQEHPSAREQSRRDPRHPERWRWRAGALPIVIGTGRCATGILIDEPVTGGGILEQLHREVEELASFGEGPVILDATRGIGLYGSETVSGSVARTLILQVLEAVSPEHSTVIVEGGPATEWLKEVPHRMQHALTASSDSSIIRVLTESADITIATAPVPEELPRECGMRLAVSAEAITVGDAEVRPHIVAASEAAEHARVLCLAAEAGGIATERGIPTLVDLADLPPADARGLAATFLMAQEPITLDLVADGPHAVVGGTTGSGKSELLVAWVTALAAAHSSERLNVLLVDFKGGASFGDLERLRHCVGMVLQDTWFFEGTIAENIAYGKKEASREEIIAAAKAARADYFIRTLPGGYDHMLQGDTDSISAGQKQLLTIARVVLCDPAILILDEATSSVDTHAEAAIGKAIKKLMADRTSFVIAHRLSTIVDADFILMMESGNIIETGNHKELLALGGAYAGLYNSQFE